MIASVQFTNDSAAQAFTVELVSGWRLCEADFAIQLVPVCDILARPVSKLPAFERVEIWPLGIGVPDQLVKAHPKDVEKMRQDHQAGRHKPSMTWAAWLEQYGKPQLWYRYQTPELQRRWLVDFDDQNPGFYLRLACRDGVLPRPVAAEVLGQISHRADFMVGQRVATVFLSQCLESLLTPEEHSHLPSYMKAQETITAQQAKLTQDQMALEKVKEANRKEDDRRARQRAQQPVTREQVIAALGIKTDRGVRKICKRHNVEWPQTQGELNRLMQEHARRKRSIGEATAWRNKARARKRRGGPQDDARGSF